MRQDRNSSPPVPEAGDLPCKDGAIEARTGSVRIGRVRVVVRKPEIGDEAEFVKRAEESLDFHRQWIKAPRSSEEFRRYLARCDGLDAAAFMVCDGPSGAIVGFINLNQIVGEPYLRGLLGYGAFVPHAGRGYMSAGLAEVVRHAFTELGLHRLEADIQPENYASKALAERVGFVRECVSKGFIRINGVWTDHERWALTSDAWAFR
jgi:[ribosomal protein S5]-alanine N-acetyltransferase